MPTLPQRGAPAPKFPFHTTQSESRILSELFSVMTLRGKDTTAWQNEDFLASRNIGTAAACIESLRAELFPEETRLRRERTDFLKPLNGGAVRAHFDQSLETAALTIHAQVQSKADYDNLLARLQAFDFEAWQVRCNSERVDAD